MKITLKLCGTDFAGIIRRTDYLEGDTPALEMIEPDGERIATLTVNFPDVPLPANHTFIKDYSENEGVLAQLIDKKIVRDTGERIRSGFVTCPVVEIIEEGLRT